jgi:hypothetical protein
MRHLNLNPLPQILHLTQTIIKHKFPSIMTMDSVFAIDTRAGACTTILIMRGAPAYRYSIENHQDLLPAKRISTFTRHISHAIRTYHNLIVTIENSPQQHGKTNSIEFCNTLSHML